MAHKKMSIHESKRRGFSLTETLISLSIIALIAAAVSTSFLNNAPKYRLQSAVREVHSRLNYARFKAIFEGEKIRVKFYSTGYALEKYDENLEEWKPERKFPLQGVTLHANNNPVFHPGGNVSNLATITLSNSWGAYRISIAISGRIKTVRL